MTEFAVTWGGEGCGFTVSELKELRKQHLDSSTYYEFHFTKPIDDGWDSDGDEFGYTWGPPQPMLQGRAGVLVIQGGVDLLGDDMHQRMLAEQKDWADYAKGKEKTVRRSALPATKTVMEQFSTVFGKNVDGLKGAGYYGGGMENSSDTETQIVITLGEKAQNIKFKWVENGCPVRSGAVTCISYGPTRDITLNDGDICLISENVYGSNGLKLQNSIGSAKYLTMIV